MSFDISHLSSGEIRIDQKEHTVTNAVAPTPIDVCAAASTIELDTLQSAFVPCEAKTLG